MTQHLVEIAPTPSASAAPVGMIKIPGGLRLQMDGIEIEGSDESASMFSIPGRYARRFHEHLHGDQPFYIDKYPVTNGEFKKFSMRRITIERRS